MKASRLRLVVQLAFLGFMSWVGYRHQLLGGGPEGAPPVDAVCPFGGMESLYIFLTTGGWLRRVAPSALVLLVAVVIMTLIVGRVFCGWICPLGTLGELSARLGRKLGIRRGELPQSVDGALRYLKYAVLVAIIFFTWKMGTLVWRNLDPWVAWMHLSAGMDEFLERPWAYLVLLFVVLLASLKIERFWCRYLCPLGALLAPLQKLALFKVRRSGDHCVHCHICSGTCPVRLDPESRDVETSAECIACGRCVDGCPKEEALFFGTARRKIPALAIGLIGLVIFFGFYGGARMAGMWKTWASPSAVITSADPTEAIFGWMTVPKIAETLNMRVEKVIEHGGLDENVPLDVPVKNIEGVNDEELKERLREALTARGGITAPGRTVSPTNEIRGSATMNELVEIYGLEAERIFKEAGWPADSDPSRPLKELAREGGWEVQEIREAIEKLLKRR